MVMPVHPLVATSESTAAKIFPASAIRTFQLQLTKIVKKYKRQTTSMFVLLLKLKKPLYFNTPTLLLSMKTQRFPIAQSPPLFPTLNSFHCSNFNLFKNELFFLSLDRVNSPE